MTKEDLVKKYFPCTCDIAYTSRRLSAPDCCYHNDCWEELMDDWAKDVAIQFKEFQDSNLEEKGWQQYDGYDRWINPHTREVISTEKLYELFLKSKP